MSHYTCFILSVRGSTVDVRIWRLKTVAELKGLMYSTNCMYHVVWDSWGIAHIYRTLRSERSLMPLISRKMVLKGRILRNLTYKHKIGFSFLWDLHIKNGFTNVKCFLNFYLYIYIWPQLKIVTEMWHSSCGNAEIQNAVSAKLYYLQKFHLNSSTKIQKMVTLGDSFLKFDI